MFDFIQNEHEILKFWQRQNVFEKMRDKTKKSKAIYRTLDGPITANGSMCIHHCWGRTLKDSMIKYNTLKGRRTHFQNGFDAQGLWVEVEVEKTLGLNGKHEILKYGVDKFTEKCIAHVNKFAEIQTRQSIRLGQIMDWENSYFTNSDHNIECIWNFLRVCHDRGMLVKSYKPMVWCPRCGTSLSEHEMLGSYKEITHKSVFLRVPLNAPEKQILKNTSQLNLSKILDNASILVWTTTPWTLSSNVAIAVNPEHKYLVLDIDGTPTIIGKQAIKVVTSHTKSAPKVLAEIKGSDLVGLTYDPILDLNIQRLAKADTSNLSHQIIPWEDVSATDGTGAVHIAPGCGSEDFQLGLKHNLKQIVPTDEGGVFTKDFEYLAGSSTVSCQDVIFDKLAESGKLFYTHDYLHNYPFCWRCKTDVIFKLVDGWDIATEEIKPDLIRAARLVNWNPEFTGKMMQDWLQNMGSWNISRRRFYGMPLPIYKCDGGTQQGSLCGKESLRSGEGQSQVDCGHITVVGSKAELRKLAVDPSLVDKIPHLHRPYIDEILIKCPKCGKPTKRVPDVGDVWLDAGIAPFSTMANNYDTHELCEPTEIGKGQNWQPSEVVIEMKEQVRLWFYSQLFMSVVLTGKAPYENVVGYGTILNEHGKKFSKSDPLNQITFDDTAEKFGIDAIRYLFSSSNPAGDIHIAGNLIDEARRKLLGLYNNFVFFKTYADIDKPDFSVVPDAKGITPVDMWLHETLDKYIRDCDAAYSSYKPHEVIENTERLVEDLSNFYIRVNRRRFWKNSNDQDKTHAYWILFQTLKSITIIMSPIIPFLCEHIWQTIIRPMDSEAAELVVISDFPKPRPTKTASKLCGQVKFVQEIISLALSLRARENLKLRQPLSTLYIRAKDTSAVKLFEQIIRDEVNVKNIEIVTSDDKFNVPFLSVNFKEAGKILKGAVQQLKNDLAMVSDVAMLNLVQAFKKGKVSVGNFKGVAASAFTLGFKSRSEFVSVTEGDLTLVLDTVLTPELVEEGELRELVRSIQVARQTAGLDITRRVVVTMPANKIIDKYKDKICEEVLATDIIQTKGGKGEIKFK